VTKYHRFPLAGAAALVLLGAAGPGEAQQNRNFDAVEIKVLPVRGNVYMLVGAGGNVTVQVGDEGILVVDTMFAELSDKLLATLRTLSGQPIRYVINTHAHPDHIGGNASIAKAGSTIAGGNVNMAISDPKVGAAVVAHEAVLESMSTREPALPFEGWPTSTYNTPYKDLFFNGEAIQIIHVPSAHSDGDSIVHFRGSDVIVSGDVFTTTSFALFDVRRGGTYQGILDGLNAMLDIAVPKFMQEGGTYIVPGHGRISDEADLAEVRDQVHMIRDRFADLAVTRNMTLPQVMAWAWKKSVSQVKRLLGMH